MDDATQPSFAGGELLAGKYRVERVIGAGGMGIVLAAKHEGLDTNVAIKLLRTAALGHVDVIGRFMREARAAVSLRSEHVARVFDVGVLEDGRPYIVMERLEGQDLGDVCEGDTLPTIAEAVDYVMQACEAIAEAHAAGIIHRDLKPKNLFLTRSVHGKPLVKVLDFGISKVEAAPGEMQLTKTTDVIGSPSYMSPEQLRSSRNVDTRTDIWALGVILYELLTGRVPFYAETVTQLVLVVVTEQQPSVRSIRPDVPEALEAVLSRCLEKQADDRYQTVVDLVQALEPFANLVQTSATERIRAVAHSGRPTPGGSTSAPLSDLGSHPTLPLVPSSSSVSSSSSSRSSRVNVSGGTSVAWGETQSAVQPVPTLTARSGTPRPILFAIAGGLGALVLLVAVGVVMIFTRTPPSPPPVVANDPPLPVGRRDLPPTVAPPPATTSTPIPSTLPDERKPAPLPIAAPAPKTPSPAKSAPPPKPSANELDGIGRR